VLEKLFEDFKKSFQEYNDRFKQWPEVCYCPEDLYDEFIEALRVASLNYDDPMSYTYFEAYYAALNTNYYITYCMVRIYKAKIDKINYNVPVRETYL
jgi:hypothetical protein